MREIFRGDSESKWKVGEHVKAVTQRAAVRSSGLGVIMPNIERLKTERRRTFHSVVQSIVFYAAHVWSSAVLTKAYRKQLTRAERKTLLRVACAYRTVSAEALLVITGCIPMIVLVNEIGRIYERRNEDSNRTFKKRRKDKVHNSVARGMG
ncbi:uncharacterized protein [Diabrotica undecimpunctata]|uniref:uncharacterized protein n=1 Tax=Diabrotica undecimpunctata TaxID=50387 RepID=UPI003B63575C